ncbi:MAG: FAD-linked oxidase C-terminal domain-containing protein [bacterium]
MEKRLIELLEKIVGEDNIIHNERDLFDYAHDEFPLPNISHMPDVAVMPRNALQVSKILRLANRESFYVTPRGGGTGLCGGCVPAKGGIVLSLEKMNRIVELDEKNYFAVAEAGVRLMDFYKEIETKGFFFPPHPGDESAMIGGVIATNAGGARTVKYGVVRNFIKGLEVVLPQGDIVTLGGKLLKNSTGYNLLHLLIGSEGTLGIITKAIIHLLPPPNSMVTLIAPFDNLEKAIDTVPRILGGKIIPMAVEFIERDTIEAAENFLQRKWPCKTGAAYLMIIIDGSSEDDVMRQAEAISEFCVDNKNNDIFIAQQSKDQKEILDFRSQIYETMKKYIIEVLDITLPPSEIPHHVKEIHEISKQNGIWLPTFGHALDGNVHTHIMRAWFRDGQWEEMPREEWQKKYPIVRKALHADAGKRGGIISGEHGIGIIKKEYLPDVLGDVQIELFKKIKKSFDPNNILNPGKIIDI